MVYVTADSLGEWTQLGLLKPVQFDVWHDFAPEHLVTTGSYRLNFECSDFSKVRSFCWVRSVYIKDGVELFSRSTRVYPKPEPLTLELPIPLNFRSAGVERQKLQLKKLFKRYASTDVLWTIKTEELYLERQTSENTFLLPLSNVVFSERHPNHPNLWVTIFEEITGYQTYEVGRFYAINSIQVASDPLVESLPNLLRTTFTSREPIKPNTLQVRIVA